MSRNGPESRTIVYVAHYDPSTDPNGAKMRLLAMARIMEHEGFRFVFVQSSNKHVYFIDAKGQFKKQGDFSDGAFFREENVICVIFSWFWAFIHSDGILSHLRLNSPRVPLVLDTIDAVGIRQYREYLASDVQTPTSSFSLEEEIREVRRADWILAITEEERDYFASMTDMPVSIVSYSEDEMPSGSKMRRSQLRLAGRTHYVTGFFGSRNFANYHSAIRSAHIAWMSGRVKRFNLAGSVCDYEDLIVRLQVRYGAWLNIIGRVETPFDFYESVDFTTNMLAFGSGIKIKVVESLTYGVPTICNYVAAEGLTTYVPMKLGLWRAETAVEYRDLLQQPLVSAEMETIGVATVGMMQRDRFTEEIRRFLTLIG
jgi:hypothetical protein